MPWTTARMAQLLSCQKSTAVLTPGNAGVAQSEGSSGGPREVDMDELVTVKESVHLGPFQTEIIEGRVKPLFGDMAHMMITPLKAVNCGKPGHFLWSPGTPCSPRIHMP